MGDVPQGPRCLVQLWVTSAFLLLVKHCFCNVAVRQVLEQESIGEHDFQEAPRDGQQTL